MVGSENNGFRGSFIQLFEIGFFYIDIIMCPFRLDGEADLG